LRSTRPVSAFTKPVRRNGRSRSARFQSRPDRSNALSKPGSGRVFRIRARGEKCCAEERKSSQTRVFAAGNTNNPVSEGLDFLFCVDDSSHHSEIHRKNPHDLYQSRPLKYCLLSAAGRRTRSRRRRRYERAAADRVKQNKQFSPTPAGANRRGFCFGACRLSHQPQGVLHE